MIHFGNNKSSIFVTYAALCVVGFAGVTLLSFTGKSNDLAAVVAFFAFYGFFCTTSVFYVLGKQKAWMESINTHVDRSHDSLNERMNDVYRQISDESRVLNESIHANTDELWREIGRIGDQVEECCESSKCCKK